MFTPCAVWYSLVAVTATTEVDVFTRGEAGYYCVKIPTLMALSSTHLLALGEARNGKYPHGCADSAKTDLVMKTSSDRGRTWSKLSLFHAGVGMHDTVGNAAPIVFDQNIVVLFNLNNSRVLMKRSYDLGQTWSSAKDITGSTALPEWKFQGLGPPAGLRLSSGRLLVSGYHQAGGNFQLDESKGHTLISDDNGTTWRISADHDFGDGYYPNENQAVQLSDGSVGVFSRARGHSRLRTVSVDGGEHWGNTTLLRSLPEPIWGCEGSTIACRGAGHARLVYSGPSAAILRDGLSTYLSDDEGLTWRKQREVYQGASGYSALAWAGEQLGLLYERANKTTIIFEPDYITFRLLESPCSDYVEALV